MNDFIKFFWLKTFLSIISQKKSWQLGIISLCINENQRTFNEKFNYRCFKNIKIFNIHQQPVTLAFSGKALNPIETTDEGIVTFLSDPHSRNAKSPIETTEEGIFISSNEEHSQKAKLPIEVTEEGISICSSEVQLMKAWVPIEDTEEGIETCLNEVQ